MRHRKIALLSIPTVIVLLITAIQTTKTGLVPQEDKHGASILSASLYAARLRFRHIVMTATVMIFGMLPLIFSSGAGAKGNIAIGAGVLGGMLVGTIALLLFVPMLFCLFERTCEKHRA